MIREDYVSLETAKLLKEKGFDEVCIGFYTPQKELHFTFLGETNSTWLDDSISAPTLQMAMKWLREVHKLHIQPYTSFDDNGNPTDWWHCFVEFLTGKRYPIDINFVSEKFDSHEQACDACIKYCLENLI